MSIKLSFLKDLLNPKKKNIITETSKETLKEAQVIVANRTNDKPFVDIKTGKSYKTESAMKGAITRRKNKKKKT